MTRTLPYAVRQQNGPIVARFANLLDASVAADSMRAAYGEGFDVVESTCTRKEWAEKVKAGADACKGGFTWGPDYETLRAEATLRAAFPELAPASPR